MTKIHILLWQHKYPAVKFDILAAVSRSLFYYSLWITLVGEFDVFVDLLKRFAFMNWVQLELKSYVCQSNTVAYINSTISIPLQVFKK